MEMKYQIVQINKQDMTTNILMSFKTYKEAESIQESLIQGKDPTSPLMYSIDKVLTIPTMRIKKQ